jgi:trans-2,3-dihydro-3-hydroxyanthranilate isomerase
MRHCYVLRVFTRGDEGGNHLGVVTDVTGLDDGTMQEIAADLGYSETVFLDWREAGIPEARIFTPTVELPFAGHPLVGAAWVLGMMGPGTVDRIRCGIGEVSFRTEDETTWVQVPLSTEVEVADDMGDIAKATRLPEPVRAWRVRLPLDYLVVDVGSPVAVVAADPDIESLADHGAGMLYLTAVGADGVKARFFAPTAGVPEDPATGSAACAYAAVRSHLGEASGEATIHQGDEIGHPSTILIRWGDGSVDLGGTVRRDEVTVLER